MTLMVDDRGPIDVPERGFQIRASTIQISSLCAFYAYAAGFHMEVWEGDDAPPMPPDGWDVRPGDDTDYHGAVCTNYADLGDGPNYIFTSAGGWASDLRVIAHGGWNDGGYGLRVYLYKHLAAGLVPEIHFIPSPGVFESRGAYYQAVITRIDYKGGAVLADFEMAWCHR